MKVTRVVRRVALSALLAFCSVALHAAEVPLVGDASVSPARPAVNFGSLSNLSVGSGQTALLQFDLTQLPAGVTSSQISKATLTVFVNRVFTRGAVTIAPVTSSWTELGVTYSTAPTTGSAAANFTASTAGQFVSIDVTSLVQGWVAAPSSNYGFALS